MLSSGTLLFFFKHLPPLFFFFSVAFVCLASKKIFYRYAFVAFAGVFIFPENKKYRVTLDLGR